MADKDQFCAFCASCFHWNYDELIGGRQREELIELVETKTKPDRHAYHAQCRRYPPTVHPLPIENPYVVTAPQTLFPTTEAGECCGEFEWYGEFGGG